MENFRKEEPDEGTPLPESAPHRVFQLTGYVLFGISVIFFMFYKFSPLGTRLSRLIRRGKGMQKDRDEDDAQNFFRNSDNSPMLPGNRNFHVVYNTMRE
ncbi:unnamed protein product [Plasmodium vivax]|uniref:(malaria parasite P. vivax) hypothetical protein n=1 Tax=Plasmodium vivax TaxID=5855 RepID=A0A8S4HKN1_PLAVI|nr:unnamed protein product [Plasmodium vivax]CAI7717853.1 hypothetical protein PVPAM_020008300 [Plasmodium vivax]